MNKTKRNRMIATTVTASMLSISTLIGNTLTADAIGLTSYGSFSSICQPDYTVNIQTIIDELANCYPNLFWQVCPEEPTPQPPVEVIPEQPDTEETESNETEANETEVNENDEKDESQTENPQTENPQTGGAGANTNEEEVKEEESDEHNQSEEKEFIKQVIELVNVEREKRGLNPVHMNANIQNAAQVRAMEIEYAFSHTRPNGTSFSTALQENSVNYRGSGENIAWGQQTPNQVMNAWMNSSGHRANILNQHFTSIGVGCYQNSNGTNYWTQLFTY